MIVKKRLSKIAGITIPCHWDISIIDQIISNNDKFSVKEVYGSLSSGGPVGHGRSRESVVPVSRREAANFCEYLKSVGIRFTYLLNAPFEFNDTKEQLEKLNEYMDWIFNDLRPDALTVASLDLMKYLRKLNPNFPIYVSTIAGIKNAHDFKKYVNIKPARIIPHHDLGKQRRDLMEIIKLVEKNNMEVEMLSTESCLRNCPSRDAHYEFLAKGNADEKFHLTCNSRKIIYPREFLLAGGIIRPEDTEIFEELGVRFFKITGRSKPKEWLPEVVRAYQERSYDGNLIRLLGIDPELKAEEWIYIENKSLNGFLDNYPQDGNYSEEIAYCDDWMVRLYRAGRFKLADGTKYEIKDGMLKLKTIGKRAGDIIGREL